MITATNVSGYSCKLCVGVQEVSKSYRPENADYINDCFLLRSDDNSEKA